MTRSKKSKGGQNTNDQNAGDNCAAEANQYVNRIFTSSTNDKYHPRPKVDISIHTRKQWIAYLESWIQYASERVHWLKKDTFKTKKFIENKTLLRQLFIEYCRVNLMMNTNQNSVPSCNINLYRFARIIILISFVIHDMVPDSEMDKATYLDIMKERKKQLSQIATIHKEIQQCIPNDSMSSDPEKKAESYLRRVFESHTYNANQPIAEETRRNTNTFANASDYHANINLSQSNSLNVVSPGTRSMTGKYRFSSNPNVRNSIRPSIRPSIRNSVRPSVRNSVQNGVQSRTLDQIFSLPSPESSNGPVSPKTWANKGRAFTNRVRGWFGYSPRYKTLKKHRFF